MRWFLTLMYLTAFPAWGQDRTGAFDYYVLSLSWSANWCVLEGDARQSPQCREAEDFDWILHGLWPQYERGYPANCPNNFRPPSRSQTSDMADIMGTSGLAWYQWNKHGVCSGLESGDYYALAREAYARINRPPVFRRVTRDISVPASVVEDAFLADNPTLSADQITITCKQGYIQESRICLTRDLEFRTCGDDVVRDCTLDDALFTPMR